MDHCGRWKEVDRVIRMDQQQQKTMDVNVSHEHSG
jgi:hypothetical protein